MGQREHDIEPTYSAYVPGAHMLRVGQGGSSV